ncbi:MAG: helix-turn-helix domain-containing protein [Candidatus Ranarchaeia archaeon]
MLVYRAYKYEINTNNQQQTKLFQHAGTERFAYNWGLEQRNKNYQEQTGIEKYTDAIKQHKKLNDLKKSQFPWMYEVSKCTPQEALRDLEQAFKNYYRILKKGSKKPGFQKFKKRGVNDSFRFNRNH